MQVLVLRSTALVISFPSVVALIHICRLSNFFFNFFNFNFNFWKWNELQQRYSMFAVCRIATVYIIRALKKTKSQKKKNLPSSAKIIPSQSICSYTLPPRARIPIPDRRTRPHSFPRPPSHGPQKRLPPSMIIVLVARKTLRPHRASPELRQTTQIRIDRSTEQRTSRPPSMYHTTSPPGPGEGRGGGGKGGGA